MYKRWIALALCLMLLISAMPMASAAGTPRSSSAMKISDRGIAFIKGQEGFCKYAVWDYGQYSIGYGTGCNPSDYPNGITEAEAERLLRTAISSFESSVNRFISRNGLSLKQNEFDALVSFTYNLGPGWTDGCRLANWLLKRGSDLELVNAMGVWCHAGGSVLVGLVNRRIREAQIFLYGDYTGKNCKQYTASWYRANGGEDLSPDVYFYVKGSTYRQFPTVKRSGYTLTGWYDSTLFGEQYYPTDVASSYRILYAHWIKADSTPAPAPTPDTGFHDVSPNSWYYSYVMKAHEENIFVGLSNTIFGPNEKMTRGMTATVIHRIAGSPKSSAKIPFTDVPSGKSYTEAVRWCYENNIIAGKTATTFEPNTLIQRQEFVALLYRFAEAKGYDLSSSANLSNFSDAASVDNFAVTPMKWAIEKGIIAGVISNGVKKLSPKGYTTRAEAAKILVTFMEAYNLI